MRLVLATRNPGKVAELRALLADLDLTLLSAADLPDAPEVDEDAPTLEGNARKKALALHEATGLPALADDTGLEVDALDGRPGVHSARYAGPEADDASNRARLLHELAPIASAQRTARFRTVIALAEAGEVRFFEGVCEGHITAEERGAGGFGYDALFIPEGHDETFAEMSKEAKNVVSHRRRALDGAAAYLRSRA